MLLWSMDDWPVTDAVPFAGGAVQAADAGTHC